MNWSTSLAVNIPLPAVISTVPSTLLGVIVVVALVVTRLKACLGMVSSEVRRDVVQSVFVAPLYFKWCYIRWTIIKVSADWV